MRGRPNRGGFTLIEVILVLAITVVVISVAIPSFSGSFSDLRLRSSVQTLSRMGKYARTMAILRQEELRITINPETREVYLGAVVSSQTSTNDGELDQDVLKRLGYIDNDGHTGGEAKIEKEQRRILPEGITIEHFEKETEDEEEELSGDLHIINYYPNGRLDKFKLEIKDSRDQVVMLESDPISGKIFTEYAK